MRYFKSYFHNRAAAAAGPELMVLACLHTSTAGTERPVHTSGGWRLAAPFPAPRLPALSLPAPPPSWLLPSDEDLAAEKMLWTCYQPPYTPPLASWLSPASAPLSFSHFQALLGLFQP